MLELYYCTKCRCVYAMTEPEYQTHPVCGRLEGSHYYDGGTTNATCSGKLNKVVMRTGNQNDPVQMFPKFIPVQK